MEHIPVYPVRGETADVRNRSPRTMCTEKTALATSTCRCRRRQPGEDARLGRIYEYAKKYKGELVVIAIGPLTNLALRLRNIKSMPGLLGASVIMGCAAVGGNATPSAEFKHLRRPEAADMVLSNAAHAPVNLWGWM
jgi:inosine-uridine nucleoside N-ribohydrolase